ncbi:PID-CTERM protein-sorting domain-containing protein [Mariniflexile sp. HMF6888]|uniref:PID-CTERM protein-sorting domain-containing protein n=1 Tax=Mariniflexile sp. HMF6888 TaxID=3373086 RepID=UPI00379AF562
MIIQNKRIVVSILFVLISFVCAAQTGDDPPPPGPPSGYGLPIDGGVLLGVCVGLFYGVKKLLFKNNNS